MRLRADKRQEKYRSLCYKLGATPNDKSEGHSDDFSSDSSDKSDSDSGESSDDVPEASNKANTSFDSKAIDED